MVYMQFFAKNTVDDVALVAALAEAKSKVASAKLWRNGLPLHGKISWAKFSATSATKAQN